MTLGFVRRTESFDKIRINSVKSRFWSVFIYGWTVWGISRQGILEGFSEYKRSVSFGGRGILFFGTDISL